MAVNGGHVRLRGEGLNNLVLTCSEAKKVYRLMKYNTLVTHQHVNSEAEKERTEKINQILENQVAYVENVIRPQILPQFIALHKIVPLPDRFAETVESDIAEGRLEVRTKKGDFLSPDCRTTIDPATKSAVMLPDLCFVTDADSNGCLSEDAPDRPTISVEIKPKKGFMPEEGTLPMESAIKYSVCKFCIHQRLKHYDIDCEIQGEGLKTKEGRWSRMSHYCPIDLFSGNRARMKHALYGLCETPQHNLKICMNGDEIYGKHVQDDLSVKLKQFFGDNSANGIKRHLVLSEFLDLIVDALLYIPSVLNGHDASEPDTEHLSTCCSNRTKQSLSNTQCCSSSIKESASCALHVNNNDSKGDKSLPEQSSQLSAPKVFKTKYNSSHETCDTEKPYAKLVNGCNCYKPSQHCQKSSYQQNNLQEVHLPHYSVLGQVLAIQALDTVDIENLYPLFLRVKEHLKQQPSDEQKWNLYGPFTAETWLRPCKDRLVSDKNSLEYAVDMVKRFNVSKTLQDCSLMVAFQRLDSLSEYKGPYLTDGHGRKFKFSVSVIDLDYKPFSKVQKWYDLENEMLKIYNEIETKQSKRSAV